MRFEQNYDWGGGMVFFSVLMVIIVAVVLLWHFAEAWRILPGAYYISGQVPVSVFVPSFSPCPHGICRGYFNMVQVDTSLERMRPTK